MIAAAAGRCWRGGGGRQGRSGRGQEAKGPDAEILGNGNGEWGIAWLV